MKDGVFLKKMERFTQGQWFDFRGGRLSEASGGPGDPLEEKFKAIIPAGVDRIRLNEFMEICGASCKQSLAQVRESAITTPEDFFFIFQGWLRNQPPKE